MRRPLLQGSTENDITDFVTGYSGPPDSMRYGMRRQCLGLRVVEGAAIGLADRCSGG